MLVKVNSFIRYFAVGMIVVGLVFGLIPKLFDRSTSPQSTSLNQGARLISQNEQLYTFLTENAAITESPSANLLAITYRNHMCALIGQLCSNRTDISRSVLGGGAGIVERAYTSIPVSGVGEMYRALAGAGLAPQVYAAEGIGFGALAGFRDLWLVFRNFSYSVLVLVMVVVSLMIMFRMKLGAQTAITIETALPRIVLSLILITFSYALAGFLIDVMYIVMGLMVTLFCAGGQYCDTVETISRYLNATPSDITTGLFPRVTGYQQPGAIPVPSMFVGAANVWGLAQALVDIFPPLIKTLIYILGTAVNYLVLGYAMSVYQNSSVGEALSGISLFTFSAGGAPKAIMGVTGVFLIMSVISAFTIPFILFVVLLMTILLLFFRIYFMLFLSFLKIMLYVTFAPLFMLIEAIPGQKAFSKWITNMFGELMTFPIVGGLFLFASVMVNNFNDGTDPASTLPNMWAPPFLNGLDQQAFLMVLGMGIVFLIPDLTKTIKKMLGVTDVGINFGLGTFIAGAAVVAAGGMGLVSKGAGINDFLYGKDSAARGVGFYGWVAQAKSNFQQRFRPSPKVDQEKIDRRRRNDNQMVARQMADKRVASSSVDLGTAKGRAIRDEDMKFSMEEHDWLEGQIKSASAHIDPSNTDHLNRVRYEMESDFRAVSTEARQQIAAAKGIDYTLTPEGRSEIRDLTRKGTQVKSEASAEALKNMQSAGMSRFASEHGEQVYQEERQFIEQLAGMRNRQIGEALAGIDVSDAAARDKALKDTSARFDSIVVAARTNVRSSGIDPLTFKGRQQMYNQVQQALSAPVEATPPPDPTT